MIEELTRLRKEIDVIDEELVKLIARRLRIVREVARVKVEGCLDLVNEVRESEVLDRVRVLSRDLGIEPTYVELLFRVLMLISLKEEVVVVRWYKECGSRRGSG